MANVQPPIVLSTQAQLYTMTLCCTSSIIRASHLTNKLKT